MTNIFCNLEDLKSGLKSYSDDTYQIFKTIYSCITHGQEFAPLVNTDLIKNYKDVAYKIKEQNYDGVFIVFDEFSKFLENIDNSKISKPFISNKNLYLVKDNLIIKLK